MKRTRKSIPLALLVLSGLIPFGLTVSRAFAGDSLYGKVTAVRSADVVLFNYGAGEYVVRIVGISVPKEGAFAAQAQKFVANLVLDKNARIRFQGRAPNGEMLSQLLADDQTSGVKDVAIELLKAGLVQRQRGTDLQFGYKYRELMVAEADARKSRRGLWAQSQTR